MSSAYGFIDAQLESHLTTLASSGLYVAVYSGMPALSGSGGVELTGGTSRPAVGGWSSATSDPSPARWYISNANPVTYTSAVGSPAPAAGELGLPTPEAVGLGICPDNAGSAPLYLVQIQPRPIFLGANVFPAGAIRCYARQTY